MGVTVGEGVVSGDFEGVSEGEGDCEGASEGSGVGVGVGAMEGVGVGVGVSLDYFGNYTILTPDMVSDLGSEEQSYIGTATHLIIDDSFPSDSLENLFIRNDTITSLVILIFTYTRLPTLLVTR